MNKYQVLEKESYSYGLNVGVPLNVYVEALISEVLVLGGGAFGRLCGLEGIMMVEFP